MKRALLLAATVAGLAFAGAASAQAPSVTGTVTVTGNVPQRCFVVGGNSSTSFSGTIPLGDLTGGSGTTLSAALSGSTAASPAGSYSAQVSCTSSNVAVSLLATELDAGLGAPSGTYSSTIDYTAGLKLTLDSAGTGTFSYNTATNTSAVTGTTGAPLANTAGNVVVSAYALSTKGGPNLRASNAYVSTITVGIAPTT